MSQIVHHHILPSIGEYKLEEIDEYMVSNVIETLYNEKNLAPASLKKIRNILVKSLDDAYYIGGVQKKLDSSIITKNHSNEKTKNISFWTEQELHCFLKAAETSRFYPIFYLAFYGYSPECPFFKERSE
jgi:integrase